MPFCSWLGDHLCVFSTIVLIFVHFGAEAVLFDVLTVLIVIFIGLRAVLSHHLVAPVPHLVYPRCELGNTEDTTDFFRCKADTCTIFVEHSEPIGTDPCSHVGHVAVVRTLLVSVLHIFRCYRGELF